MELRIPMQPTAQPGWPGWPGWEPPERFRRRFRLTLRELAELRNLRELRALGIDWNQPRHEIALYVPKNLRHLIRFDSAGNGNRAPAYPTADGSWRADHYPLDTGPWRIPDLQHIRLEAVPPAGAGAGASAGGAARRWEGAARAWAAGALVLAVLVLVVRAVEKCLHRKFFKARRRRQSEEWPTPNVLATSHRNGNDLDLSIPRMEDSDAFPSESNQDSISNDLPPPYSECATSPGNDGSKYGEEPPPPYSACYVAYSNPKDGIPSVHFYNRNRQVLFQDSGHSSNGNERNDQINEGKPDDVGGDRELVFENGRIIERDGSIGRETDNQRNVHGSGDNNGSNAEHVITINVNQTNVPADRSLQV